MLLVGSVLSTSFPKKVFFFPGCNMVRGLWTSFGKSFIIINLPTPKKMSIYYKASFSKDWTQSAYLLSVASNLCFTFLWPVHCSALYTFNLILYLFFTYLKNVRCYSTPRNKVTSRIRLLFSLDHSVTLYTSLLVKTRLLKLLCYTASSDSLW